jgi:hypothetical protein
MFRGLTVPAMLAQQPREPVFINIQADPKDDISGLADVLIGALGLAGALILAAVLIGIGFGAVVFWLRSRSASDPDDLAVTRTGGSRPT